MNNHSTSRLVSTLALLQKLAPCATLLILAAAIPTLHAQDIPSCSLGHIQERVQPQYPLGLNGRIVEGVVQVQANFAPDGHVSSSKVISGPQPLRFDSEAYVRGWRAEKSESQRSCVITLDYRFNGSQGVCGPRNETHIRAEREDETHVLLHLSCDIW